MHQLFNPLCIKLLNIYCQDSDLSFKYKLGFFVWEAVSQPDPGEKSVKKAIQRDPLPENGGSLSLNQLGIIVVR